jgi:hypothetical protein
MSEPKFGKVPTDLGSGPEKDDWILRVNGEAIGRCYAGKFGMHGEAWRWSIYGTSLAGIEPSLGEAEAAFKRAYVKWTAS